MSAVHLLLYTLSYSSKKALVFSQWTSLLRIIAKFFDRDGIQFVMLDGQMSMQKRKQAVQKFSEDNDIVVFMLSIKAGGVGLNLTVANHVFLCDPWWNPAVEQQVHGGPLTYPVVDTAFSMIVCLFLTVDSSLRLYNRPSIAATELDRRRRSSSTACISEIRWRTACERCR